MFSFPDAPVVASGAATEAAPTAHRFGAGAGRQADREDPQGRRRRIRTGTLVQLDAGIRPPANGPFWNGWANGARSSRRASASSKSAKTCSNRPKSAWKRAERAQGSGGADRAAAQQKETKRWLHQLKSLVIMYENMKAKDAASIFDRLEMRACDRSRHADQSAPDGRHLGANVPERRAATDGRNGQYARTTISKPGQAARPAQDRRPPDRPCKLPTVNARFNCPRR